MEKSNDSDGPWQDCDVDVHVAVSRTCLLGHPHLAVRVSAVQALDHPTDCELLSHAREFSQADDRMHKNPPSSTWEPFVLSVTDLSRNSHALLDRTRVARDAPQEVSSSAGG
jgi:hypothetical protein